MLWLRIIWWMVLRGAGYGFVLGSLFGALVSLTVDFRAGFGPATYPLTWDVHLLQAVVGGLFGAWGGLVVGGMTGAGCAFIIRLFFFPPRRLLQHRLWLHLASGALAFAGGMLVLLPPLHFLALRTPYDLLALLLVAIGALVASRGLPVYVVNLYSG